MEKVKISLVTIVWHSRIDSHSIRRINYFVWYEKDAQNLNIMWTSSVFFVISVAVVLYQPLEKNEKTRKFQFTFYLLFVSNAKLNVVCNIDFFLCMTQYKGFDSLVRIVLPWFIKIDLLTHTQIPSMFDMIYLKFFSFLLLSKWVSA